MRAVIAAAFAATASAAAVRGGTDADFTRWVKAHGKTYTPEEHKMRSKIFAANVATVNSHNGKKKSWTMAVNKFADLTHEEFRAIYTGGRRSSRRTARPAALSMHADELIRANGPAPAAWDWRDPAHTAVTAVKNQGQCGSCWAFSTTVATEGAHAIFTKFTSLISLSEQQIVSCDIRNGDGNDGCNGGLQMAALEWLAKQPSGQCSEASYPYSSAGGTTGKCKAGCEGVVKVSAGAEVTPQSNETALVAAIYQQPVALSVDASSIGWQFYSGGTFTDSCSCTSEDCLDHGVGGVGYGTDSSGNDYYIVKNSWGSDWGASGYIMLARGDSYGPSGQCGVQIDNQIAIVSN